MEKMKIYNRNVSIVMLPVSVLVLGIGLALSDKFPVIPNGVLLGGVFTLFFSIITGFQSENDKFRFLIVTVGLLVAVIIGYIKFIKPMQEKAD